MRPNTSLKFMCSMLIFSMAGTAFAQDTLLQKTITRLASYQNFSYSCTYKQKEVFSDTLIMDKKFTLLKADAGVKPSYLFRYQFQYAGMSAPTQQIFNGEELIQPDATDSTFTIGGNPERSFQQMLPAKLRWLQDFYRQHPAKLSRLNDTLYYTAKCYQLRLTTKDTIICNKRQFVRIYIFIDQKTGLPAGWITRSRTNDFGKEINDYYTEEIYRDYLFNQPLEASDFRVPPSFHPVKPEEPPVPLRVGSAAPGWTLYDTHGQQISLSAFKGQPVLLDFFFVGCGPCLKTLAPLDSVYRKYQKKGLMILSISDRDNQKAAAAFKKAQRIENTILAGGHDVAAKYHVSGFPTLYLIDQQGRIAGVMEGYGDDFGRNLSAQIEGLFKKRNQTNSD